MELTVEESRDLARRMSNLGARLDPLEKLRIADIATRLGYRAAIDALPMQGDRGNEQVVTIETAAWIISEIFAGKMKLDVALKTLRTASEEGL